MSTIVFINPSTDKSSLTDIWQSKLLLALKGQKNAYLPKLVGMVLAAVTPEEHKFLYVEDETEVVDYDMDVDIVAISTMTETACRTYMLAEEFRKRGKTVVIGGIHAAVMPEEVAEHCDSLMIGEGENTWPVLLEDYKKGQLKKVYNAKDYPPVEVLVSPRIDIINHSGYISYPVQATRGCPYDCDFCSIKYSSGHHYRMKPVEQVVREIQEYEKYNKPGIGNSLKKGYYFVDDNLYVNREYVKALMIALKDLNIKWDAQGTINMAHDDEMLTLMAESGCRSLGIGLESISEETLKEANKPKVNDVKDYNTAIRNIAAKGIVPNGYFIFGFDTDDVSIFRRTLEFANNSDLVQIIINLLTPYVGTKLYDRMKDRIFNTACFCYNAWTCVYVPKNMTVEQLQLGTYWLGTQICDLHFMRRQFKRFWNLGPWKTNPPLTSIERTMLVFIGIKLGLYGLGKYASFVFWAARQKNAADFHSILWTLRRYEIACKIPNWARNPET